LRFGWDNERPKRIEDIADFSIQRHDTTNGAFLEFVEAGGYNDPRWWRPDDWQWLRKSGLRSPLFWERVDSGWHWRGMFDLVPLPPSWPVFVTYAEALAYTTWQGVRLPSEGE